jgi:hypothetical protein
MTSMDPVRGLVASAELDRVLELSADERARYLAALHARDATLAADLAFLLDEHRALDAQASRQKSASKLSERATNAGRLAPGAKVLTYGRPLIHLPCQRGQRADNYSN